MKLHSRVLAFALAAAACGGGGTTATTTTTAPPKAKPLYDRLGGVDAISAVVKDFVEERVAKDSRIDARFANTDIPRLEQLLTDQICEATGGPCKYTGRTMKETHAGMGISEGDFGALVEDLRMSLDTLHVPKAEQDELVKKLATMHDDIVENR